MIFNFYLLPASASLCTKWIIKRKKIDEINVRKKYKNDNDFETCEKKVHDEPICEYKNFFVEF